jgi:hypothetical protein
MDVKSFITLILCLIFAEKGQKPTQEESTTWIGSIRQARVASDKRSILFGLFVSDGEKKLCNIDTGSCGIGMSENPHC